MLRGISWAVLAASILPAIAQTPVNLSGTVRDSAGTPVAGATVQLERGNLSTTSAADGKFTLTGTTGLAHGLSTPLAPTLRDDALQLSLPTRTEVSLKVFGPQGEELASRSRLLDAGSHGLLVPPTGTGLRFVSLTINGQETWLRALSIDGTLRSTAGAASEAHAAALRKSAAVAMYDAVLATKAGFEKAYVTLSNSDSSGIDIRMLPESNKFSFFVISMRTLQSIAKNDSGLGGDFRFGETGPGAGLRGADKICATVAELSMKGSKVKGWRAFLSVTSDAYGKQVNAIDRVGPGPWYDRVGRLLAPTRADLVAVRPKNGDPTIQLDLPNEFGVPNHRPDPTKPAEDNHHMITGSNASGNLSGATATCKDWTTSVGSSANGKPAHGYAWPRGGQVGSMGSNWMATGSAAGCGKGIEIIETGPGSPNATFIGSGGGYGGWYCFALNP